MTTTSIRRIITGFTADGHAVVTSDAAIASTKPDHGEKWSIWASDDTVGLPGDGTAPPFRGPLLPAPGGVHVTMFTLPPRFDPDRLWPTDDLVEREQLLRANLDPSTHPVVPDPNPYGYGTARGASALHATASIDCIMQVSGNAVFVLPDAEIRLRPGDWLVVNGVPHSFRNDEDGTAVLVGIVIGAHHAGIPTRSGRA